MTMASVDRISTLPDCILCRILSFLPTEQAVATSVLSKRWNPLWLSVHSLQFDDQDMNAETYHRFQEFVYAVLLSRATTTLPIKAFRLICKSNHGDPSRNLKKWVSFVLQRGVTVLQLETSAAFNRRLPDGILSCQTLLYLRLCGFLVKDVSFTGLPSLKVLRLESLRFPDARQVFKLLSLCPVLEMLEADKLVTENDAAFTLAEVKSLEKLVEACIYECKVNFPLKAVQNVSYLQFDIYEEVPDYNDIPIFHNLISMDLFFKKYDWNFILEVINHCPKLQILMLDNEAHKNYDPDWMCPESVAEAVLLHLTACTLKNYQGMKGELQFARYIMQNASVLRTMEIHSTLDSNSDAKLEMIKSLSLLERRSATCRLSFK